MTRLTIEHSDVGEGGIHGIANWIFADLGERDAFTGIIATDVHKVCYVQAGTGEYFSVSAVHPTTGVVTWHSLGGDGGTGGSNTTDLSISGRNSSTFQLNSSNGADVAIPAVTDTLAGLMTAQQSVKLATIAEGATVNSSDAYLLNRANHIGSQLASTISNFASASLAVNQYRHEQVSALDTWTINHNLGFRPNIMVYSVGGLHVSAEIIHITDTQAQVLFDSAFDGYAVCS